MQLAQRAFDKLFSGRFTLLIMFGFTLCAMALSSLIAIILTKNVELAVTLTKIIDTLIGFIAGAYTTMWNNYNYRNDRTKSEKPEGEEKK